MELSIVRVEGAARIGTMHNATIVAIIILLKTKKYFTLELFIT